MLNNYLVPIVVLVILGYGFVKKCNIYESFVEGSIDGLKIVVEIIPVMLAMIFAVNVFVGSDILGIIGGKYKVQDQKMTVFFVNISLTKPRPLGVSILLIAYR